MAGHIDGIEAVSSRTGAVEASAFAPKDCRPVDAKHGTRRNTGAHTNHVGGLDEAALRVRPVFALRMDAKGTTPSLRVPERFRIGRDGAADPVNARSVLGAPIKRSGSRDKP